MQLIHKSNKTPKEIYSSFYKSVPELIGPIEKGMDIFALTGGQFSFVDLIDHIVNYIGKCHMVISTWTAAGASIQAIDNLMKRNELESMKWIIDRSFVNRQPELCNMIKDRFGDDSIRSCKCHAKFMLVWNDKFDITLRTSMNLNRNLRIEDFTITEDFALCEFMRNIVKQMFELDVSNEFRQKDRDELHKFVLPEIGKIDAEKEKPLCFPQLPLNF